MSCSRRPGNDTLLQYAAEEVVCWWKDKKQQAVSTLKALGCFQKRKRRTRPITSTITLGVFLEHKCLG